MSRDWLLFPVDQEDTSSSSACASEVIGLISNRALDDYLIALPFKPIPWKEFKCLNDQYFRDGWSETAETWLRGAELRLVTASDIVRMTDSIDQNSLELVFPDNLNELKKFRSMPSDQKIVVVYY